MKRISLILLALFALASPSFAQTTAQDLTRSAWAAWQARDLAQAEKKFREALGAQPHYTPAELGLFYLAQARKNNQEAFRRLNEIVRNDKDFAPYAFATMNFVSQQVYSGSGVDTDYLQYLTEHSDAGGTLRAIASEMLGLNALRKGEIAQAERYFSAMNAIMDWKVIGPFENVSASGFDKAMPPETEFKADAKYKGRYKVDVHWFAPVAHRRDRWVDFDRFFSIENAFFYANTFVYSPQKQRVQLRIGTSGSIKAFLNDELFLEDAEETNNDLDTYVNEAELQSGWNRVLLKLGCSDIERCNFLLRITDGSGNPVEGLKISAEAQNYASKPKADFRKVEHFAERFFRDRIKENPDDPANYILLADTYHHNDKSVESQLVLLDAQKKYPDAAFVNKALLETYLRAKKYDEYNTLLERMFTLDSNNIDALETKISQHIDSEEFDEAESLFRRYQPFFPEAENTLSLQIKFAAKRNQSDQLLELVDKAYRRYPDNGFFTYLQSRVELQKTQSYERPIELFKRYLKNNYTPQSLIELASMYQEAQQPEKWDETYAKVFELDPSLCGYYNDYAEKLLAQQRYEDAEKAVRRAIELCPLSSRFNYTLGNIYRSSSRADKARQAYTRALELYPTYYDAREAIRDLDGKKSVFSSFEQVNTDSIIKNAPAAEDYPGESIIILHQDLKRVVYPGGASEYQSEFIAKALNSDGVDALKEYYVGTNSYSEASNIDKAVSIKSDGREIKADIAENQVVFKSLEPGDMILVRYSVKNYYAGKLSEHFWDTYGLNGFVPILHTRYTLLVPESLKFSYKVQGAGIEPVKKRTEDGMLYTWSLKDEPAMEYEIGMPPMADVGKYLHVSSISSWAELVNWYADLTHSKTKSTHEIREEVDKLLAGRKNLSDEEKIALVYNFITENIRYSSIPFRQSGHIPQKARDVLVTKIGDCKDVATLSIAMLREMGVKAGYVLLNTRDEGQNRFALPSPNVFNHCIAAVETKSGPKYLDLTAQDFPLGSVPPMDEDAFMLVIKDGVSEPQYLSKKHFTAQNISRKTVASIDDANLLSASTATDRCGALTAYMRAKYRNLSAKDQEKAMKETLSESYPNLRLTRMDLGNLDTNSRVLSYLYEFQVPDYVQEAGQFRILKMPWADPMENSAALAYEERRYQMLYPFGSDTLSESLELSVPPGYKPMDLGNSVRYSSPVMDYEVQYKFNKGKILATRRVIQKKDLVNPEEYNSFKEFYNKVVKEDTRQILLSKAK